MKHVVFILLLIGALSAWTQLQERASDPNAQAATHYIPMTLDDCFRTIDNMWDENKRGEMRKFSEQEFLIAERLELGAWMEEHWGLVNESPLVNYFHDLGVTQTEEMSSIILRSYHRYLNNRPLAIEALVQEGKTAEAMSK